MAIGKELFRSTADFAKIHRNMKRAKYRGSNRFPRFNHRRLRDVLKTKKLSQDFASHTDTIFFSYETASFHFNDLLCESEYYIIL